MSERGEMGWPDGPLFAEVQPSDRAMLQEANPRWSIRWITDGGWDLMQGCVTVDGLPEKLCIAKSLRGEQRQAARLWDQQMAFRDLAREAAQRLREAQP